MTESLSFERLCAVVVSMGAIAFSLPAGAGENCPAKSADSASPPVQVGPFTLQIFQDTVIPTPATDGLIHLAYAALVTNLQTDTVKIDQVTPVDPRKDYSPSGKSRVVDTHGNVVEGKVRLFNPSLVDGPEAGEGARYSDLVPGGHSGIMFFDVSYDTAAAVPALLSHKIVVTNTKTGSTQSTLTNAIAVSCEPPVVLRPPLVGHGWWNANGCCAIVDAHRSATLPVNGNFKVPEQFAIDFLQLDDKGGCCTGPVRALSSWPFYGAPVLAAASGKVVEMATNEREQVPSEPLVGVTAANAPGNHIVQDIGGGRYILYAHLRIGSIPSDIRPGTVLKAGQQIGQLGNTGSSTAPHLHFQVMDRLSPLNATGLPFVFEQQVVEGTVKENTADAEHQYESGSRLTVQKVGTGEQLGKMPAEGQVFGYNLDQAR